MGGKVCPAPVQLVELCSLPPYIQASGNSLTGLLKKPGKKWKYPALSFYGVGNVAVRDERYRLIQYEDGSQELYNMIKDPNEWENLANNKGSMRQIKKMKAFIPENWAPLSEFSNYDFNEYFNSKSTRK